MLNLVWNNLQKKWTWGLGGRGNIDREVLLTERITYTGSKSKSLKKFNPFAGFLLPGSHTKNKPRGRLSTICANWGRICFSCWLKEQMFRPQLEIVVPFGLYPLGKQLSEAISFALLKLFTKRIKGKTAGRHKSFCRPSPNGAAFWRAYIGFIIRDLAMPNPVIHTDFAGSQSFLTVSLSGWAIRAENRRRAGMDDLTIFEARPLA